MSLTLTIRPLALLGISDYFTRAKLSAQKEAYGALLGRIEGRELIIENAFELKVDFNEMRFDPAFCEAKLEQCMVALDVLANFQSRQYSLITNSWDGLGNERVSSRHQSTSR